MKRDLFRAIRAAGLAAVLPWGLEAPRARADDTALDLPARAIFSKGPNEWDGEALAIYRGRGADLGWYVLAGEDDEVEVFIEYSSAEPLNQEYHLSFDGADAFWEAPVTGEGIWAEAELGRFRLRGGVPALVMLVPPSNKKYPHPVRFRKLALRGGKAGNLALSGPPEAPPSPKSSPGFGEKVRGLHPSLEAMDLRPEGQVWRITGMAVRGGRELLFTTWEGDLYQIDLDSMPGFEAGASVAELPWRRIARGLSEPMGLAVWGERIFVTEKNEVTELIDEDGDGVIETYRCVAHDWPCTLDYHEYLFGAAIRPPHLYFAASVAMGVRDRDNSQAPLRGSVFQVHLDTGGTEVVAGGLRTPNGIGTGPGGSIVITDNQGEWLPGSKLVRLEPEAFYHFRSRPPWHPFDRPEITPPAAWLPHGEISASPTEPVLLPESWGPYAGHLLYGDATFGGLQRVFLEEVDGVAQGAAFRFSQGFRHLFNRLALDPEGDLWAGGIARGNDQEFIERVSGLTRARYTGEEAFEMLATRIRSDGLEIEFTRPLAEGAGWDPAGYFAARWGYQATQTYGGAKVRHRRAEVRSASVSEDRRRVFLELPDLAEGEVLYLRLPESLAGEGGSRLWAGEAWYTVNRIPREMPGEIRPRPAGALEASAPYFTFGGGDLGRTLYQNFCAACHSLDGTRLVGPTFQGMLGAPRRVIPAGAEAAREALADEAYIRESILDPNALVVEGYPDIMPPLGAALSAEQIEAIVDYVIQASR